MHAVIDSSSLIFLFKSTTLLKLIIQRFNKVVVPKAVYEEVVEQGKEHGKEGAIEIENGLRGLPFTVSKETGTIKAPGVDKGESEALFLANKHKCALIADDKAARKIAASLGINVVPLSAFIVWGAKNKRVTKTEAIQTLTRLVKQGYYLKSQDYVALLEAIEET